LIYACLYLSAFWNPLAKLDKLPVAVVNNDEAVVFGGAPMNVGEQISGQLKAAGNLKYNFDENDASAKKALENGKYFAVITIPTDFSTNIASGFSADKKIATITFSANEGNNYLASQIMNSVINQLEKSVRGTVNEIIVNYLASAALVNPAIPAQLDIAEWAKAPVVIVAAPINHVPNYGTAFAPYFFCLSLWLGGIIIFLGLYLDPKKRLRKLSRESDNRIQANLVFLAIALAQALVLAVLGFAFLGLGIQHFWLYFLACFLISVAFVSIIAFLFQFVGDAGKLLAILLLILQLSACGGTYPVQTLPGFFRVINPAMPMTYGVNLLRQAISSTKLINIWVDIVVLAGIAIVFCGLNFFLASRRKAKSNA